MPVVPLWAGVNHPMYRLESISKSYDGERVLDNVTLTVSRGKRTVLIGPSRSGKSTLFRLMTGLV